MQSNLIDKMLSSTKRLECDLEEFVRYMAFRMGRLVKEGREELTLFVSVDKREPLKIFHVNTSIDLQFLVTNKFAISRAIEEKSLDDIFGYGFTNLFKSIFSALESKELHNVECSIIFKPTDEPKSYLYNFVLDQFGVRNDPVDKDNALMYLTKGVVPLDYLM